MTPQYLTIHTFPFVAEYMRNMANEGNYKVMFKPVAQRTIDQNRALHAKCKDISEQVVLIYADDATGSPQHYGLKKDRNFYDYKQFSHTDWKHILMAGFAKAETVPGLEPGQVVCLYPSTTDLSYIRGMDFIEYINAYAAEMGVTWSEPEYRHSYPTNHDCD